MADTAVISAAVQGAAVSAQGTPDTTVAVASGFVSVANQLAGVTAGNLTISGAHTTEDRIDAVVVDSTGTKSVITGSISDGLNVRPPDTTGYTPLAYVYVFNRTHSSYTGTITPAAITDARDFATLD